MKVLWIVNTIFPYPAKKLGMKKNVFGGWLISLSKNLEAKKEIDKLGIIALYYGDELLEFTKDKITYYLVPTKNIFKYNSEVENKLQKIVKEFKPKLVHIHGTEYPHSLAMINVCKKYGIKSYVSVQGLISECGKKEYYYADIKMKDIVLNITPRDILKRDSIINQIKKFKKRGIYEKEILKECTYIIGRTEWDKECTFNIVGEYKYRKNNECLRESFYNYSWDISNVEPHSIFFSQATYPLKGFHKLLLAAKKVKEKYPDLKINVAGENIINKNKLRITGYGKYLNKLIKKYHLEKNIVFTGLLDEKDMIKRLLKTHVFVQSSSLENSPNSLAEAMILGLPCIASNVGGTKDLLVDKKEGFLYSFLDDNQLANYIIKIFEDDELSKKIGKNAQKHAKKTHDIIVNTNKLLDIYKEVNNK